MWLTRVPALGRWVISSFTVHLHLVFWEPTSEPREETSGLWSAHSASVLAVLGNPRDTTVHRCWWPLVKDQHVWGDLHSSSHILYIISRLCQLPWTKGDVVYIAAPRHCLENDNKKKSVCVQYKLNFFSYILIHNWCNPRHTGTAEQLYT